MTNKRKKSLPTKLFLMTILIMAISLCVVICVSLHKAYTLYNEELREDLVRLVSVVGEESIDAIIKDNPEAAERAILALKRDKNIIQAGLLKPNNSPLASLTIENHPFKNAIEPKHYLKKMDNENAFIVTEENALLYLKVAITYHKQIIAYIYVVYDTSKLGKVAKQITYYALAIFLGGLGLSALLLYLMQKPIMQPLVNLSNKMALISKTDDYQEIKPEEKYHRDDETGMMVAGFNSMLMVLQSYDRRLEDKNKEISYMAYHDSLTKLPNLTLFKEFLSYHTSSRDGSKFAVLFIDLDNFKAVNDTFGHLVGDELLKAFSNKLKKVLRKTDFTAIHRKSINAGAPVARMGGDEFITLLRGIDNEESINRVLKRIFDEFDNPICFKDIEVRVEVSIGISIYPNDSTDIDELIQYADSAMYEAKQRGKNQYQFFNKALHVSIKEQFYIEQALRKALDNHEFFLHYQPQVNIQTESVVGFEALIRWNHPERGLIPPGRFIPVAEASHVILLIGYWILKEACEVLSKWQKAGFKDLQMSVNISPLQFKDKGLLPAIKTAIINNQIRPNTLVLEITEGALMEDYVFTSTIRKELETLGVLVSIDDFGTGFSSFRYLIEFSANVLKIDKCFIDDIVESEDAKLVANSIKGLADGLDMKLVAEGVETAGQLNYLKRNNYEIVQGYIFSKPCIEQEAEAYLYKMNKPHRD